MNPKDAILQDLTPVIPVPRFEALGREEREGSNHRFLAAGDGLWVDVENAWLHARVPIATSVIPLPFGMVETILRFKCGKLPKTLLAEFIQMAKQATPKETAAIITWRRDTDAFDLIPVTIDAGTAHVHYERPRLADGEYLVADLHSHGAYPAGFSAQDDEDDNGAVKVSVVVGRCDTETPDICLRLCLLGAFVPLSQRSGQAEPEVHQ